MLINDNDALTIWKNNELELNRLLESRRLANSVRPSGRPIGRLAQFVVNLLFLR